MFFTQDDYKKIQQWLIKNSVKDTEFNEANIPFNGEETITIVQGNQNKKVFLKDLIAQVFNLGISDFVNITDKYDAPNISLEEAIRLIPSRARKEGQVITFLDMEDHWHIYQFKGALNQWNILDTWEDLFDWEKLIIDSILPDEEDLTKSLPDANGNSYLSLKDREYNPEDFSGLGRVILRKNIVEIEDPIYGKVKKNVLYQDMFTQPNTVYECRYDFDLNGQDINLPDNSYIEYNGGSISNGNIIDNAKGLNRIILRKNIKEGKNILTQDMIDKENTIYEIRYDFDLNGQEITIPEGCVLDFQGGSLNNGIIDGNYCDYIGSELNFSNLIYKNFCVIDNGIIIVDRLTNYDTHKYVDDIVTDDYFNLGHLISKCIEKSVKKYGKADVIFSGDKYYCFASPIILRDNTSIYGNGCNIEFQTSETFWMMDGHCAFITNRYNKAINGDINNYNVTYYGTKNLKIEGINFTNVDKLKNIFDFSVNSERGFIAINTCENIKIKNITCNNVKVPMCFIWMVNVKNAEVSYCEYSQSSEFNKNGTGGLWTILSDYLYGLNIHHNRFISYGDECINIDCVNPRLHSTKSGLQDIVISNNELTGSFPIAMYNYNENVCKYVKITDNVLNTITGVITQEQANPHSILFSGFYDTFYVERNIVYYNDVTDDNTFVNVYPQAFIKNLYIHQNSNINDNKYSICNNVSLKTEYLSVKGNVNFCGEIRTHPSTKNIINIEDNKFRLINSYSFNVPNLSSFNIINNSFISENNIVLTLSGYGKIDLYNNYFENINITIDESQTNPLYNIINNRFKLGTLLAGKLSSTFKDCIIEGNQVISQYDAISQKKGKDVGGYPDDYIKSTALSTSEFGFYRDNMLVFNHPDKLMFIPALLASGILPENVKAGYSMLRLDIDTGIPIWWTGGRWVYANGYTANKYKGNDSERPSSFENSDKGFQYFDTTLNKPIWWTGSKWVDATGADV